MCAPRPIAHRLRLCFVFRCRLFSVSVLRVTADASEGLVVRFDSRHSAVSAFLNLRTCTSPHTCVRAATPARRARSILNVKPDRSAGGSRRVVSGAQRARRFR
eukprot:1322909-Prymnesium_polylepis.1